MPHRDTRVAVGREVLPRDFPDLLQRHLPHQLRIAVGVPVPEPGRLVVAEPLGEGQALESAAQRVKIDIGAFTVVDTVSLMSDYIQKHIETPYDAHAGEFETSTSLANRQGHVKVDKIKKPQLTFPASKYTKIGLNAAGPKVFWGFRTKEITDTGVIGDPTKASKEKGMAGWEVAIERLAELLTELDKMQI